MPKTAGLETGFCWKFCIWLFLAQGVGGVWSRSIEKCGPVSARSLCRSVIQRWVKYRQPLLIAVPPSMLVRAPFLWSGGRCFVSALTELESA